MQKRINAVEGTVRNRRAAASCMEAVKEKEIIENEVDRNQDRMETKRADRSSGNFRGASAGTAFSGT
jgi:hypothetical protein